MRVNILLVVLLSGPLASPQARQPQHSLPTPIDNTRNGSHRNPTSTAPNKTSELPRPFYFRCSYGSSHHIRVIRALRTHTTRPLPAIWYRPPVPVGFVLDCCTASHNVWQWKDPAGRIPLRGRRCWKAGAWIEAERTKGQGYAEGLAARQQVRKGEEIAQRWWSCRQIRRSHFAGHEER